MIYINAFKKATRALRKLVTEESQLGLFYDKHYQYRGNTFFNIVPTTVTVLENWANLQLRKYEAEMKLYVRKEGYGEHTHMHFMQQLSERINRLFKNNPSPENIDGATWVTYFTRFGHSVDYWNLVTSYTMHNLTLDEMTYDPPKNDVESPIPGLHIVQYDISFELLEQDYE